MSSPRFLHFVAILDYLNSLKTLYFDSHKLFCWKDTILIFVGFVGTISALVVFQHQLC